MAAPSWRPPPATEGLSISAAARVRNRWRALLAVRWRYPEARAQDARLGRLPEDWHDWMHCPALDQEYNRPDCTCDQWLHRRPPRRFGVPRGKQIRQCLPWVVIVKSIDRVFPFPTLAPHDVTMASPPTRSPGRTAGRGAFRTARTVQSRPDHHRRQTRRGSVLSCQPTWLGGARCPVPAVRRAGGSARRLAASA